MSIWPQTSAGNPTFGFWQARRPLRAVDPVSRGRPRRQGGSGIWTRPTPVELTVKLEVEKFKFYGKLRPTQTDVHNSLPSCETIQTEKTLMSFEESRRSAPEHTLYDDFYRTLTSSITPLPGTSRASEATLRSSRLSSRAGPPETPKTTVFTLFPHLPHGQRTKLSLSNRQSVVARVVTSYGRRPSQSLLDDLRPPGGHASARSALSGSRDREGSSSSSSTSPSAAGRELLSSAALSSREGGGDMERPSCAVLSGHREDSREVVSRDSREVVSRDSREMSRGASESEPNSHRFLDVGENHCSLSSRF